MRSVRPFLTLLRVCSKKCRVFACCCFRCLHRCFNYVVKLTFLPVRWNPGLFFSCLFSYTLIRKWSRILTTLVWTSPKHLFADTNGSLFPLMRTRNGERYASICLFTANVLFFPCARKRIMKKFVNLFIFSYCNIVLVTSLEYCFLHLLKRGNYYFLECAHALFMAMHHLYPGHLVTVV